MEECLQSVVDQTLEDLQVIMVDDGSLDGSTDIAKKFASRYDHFEYVRQVNGGLGNARNTSLLLQPALHCPMPNNLSMYQNS